ncbi:acyl-CoA thioesterase [Orrella dioscoreae]|uniref:4-hydroxybenzoyl-CoA thioesterase n=1 Tax=Orrella dioscoreae TaxID=1851544 RepID=A0A1C3K4E1_9BURK|nr:thioesterase family protein [Orrella dioscoreae]SBT26376.1 4-hydroxybenzoyl-CoA thioesterase [Orrella dioscoreae]SOE46562.1 4-hydroxybenzoyl-CoA thioesterase [Orrella dioscoreae]
MLTIIDDGKPAPAPVFQARIPVRWGDLDADGHVNNTVFLRYVEEARMQWAQALSLAASAPGLTPVVANLACEYLAPLHYPATVIVSIACAHAGNSSLQLLFSLHVPADAADLAPALHARARITWVWLDAGTGRPHAMPESLRAACTAAAPSPPSSAD